MSKTKSEIPQLLAQTLIPLFDLKLKWDGKKYRGSCPVHGGDNPTAFVLFPDGRWRCYTHQCHDIFCGTGVGLFRGIKSKENGWSFGDDDKISWAQTLRMTQGLGSLEYVEPPNPIQRPKAVMDITLDEFAELLKVPCPYYSRRFTKEIVSHFSIGFCNNPKSRLYKRSVAPMVLNGRVIGALGRSIYRKCELCNSFHAGAKCPDVYYPKWKAASGFRTDLFLFNIDAVQPESTVFVTESVGNVLRLHQLGFTNAVATFGTQFSVSQKKLLQAKSPKLVVFIKDAGEPGEKAAERFQKKMSDTLVEVPELDITDDIAAAPSTQFDYLKQTLKEFV